MKKKDIFVQDSANSCGACSIASIVSYYDGYVPLETILEDTDTGLNGTNALNLVETLKKYGFDSYGERVDFENIDKTKLPVIAHTNKNGLEHFLVIYEIDESILTMDPEVGKKVYKTQEFKDIYTGNIICMTPNGSIPHYKVSNSLNKYIINLFVKHIPYLKIILIISLFTIALNLILSFHLKLLNISASGKTLTIVFIILCILTNSLDYIKNVIITNLIEKIDFDATHKFTTHIFKLPRKNLLMRKTGEIMSKIEEMSMVKDIFIRLCILSTLDIMTIIFTSIVMLGLSKPLTLIYLLSIILYLIIALFTHKTLYKEEKKSKKLYEEYSGSLVEYLGGIESIKNLNSENVFLNHLRESYKNYTSHRKKKDKLYLNVEFVNANIINIGTLIANFIGFKMLSNSFTFLELLTVNSLFNIVFTSCESILNTFKELIRCKAIYRRACEFYDLEIENCDQKFTQPLKNIKIENLTFSYNRFNKTLRSFNYTFKRGEKVLIKGPSGIGKSTLVKCISGLIDNYEGNIFINDVNTKQISNKSQREIIVYIGQEESLFTNTIQNNITLGNFNAEMFNKVVTLASLNELLENKRTKEHTMLLEGASNISGGERARLILARALYKEPQVLIIDETLSSVSEEMENEILEKLLKMDDISIIYITHRNKDSFFKNIIEFRKDGNYEITRK